MNTKPSSPTSTLWTVLDAEAAAEDAVEDALVVILVSFGSPYWALMNGSPTRTKRSALFIVRKYLFDNLKLNIMNVLYFILLFCLIYIFLLRVTTISLVKPSSMMIYTRNHPGNITMAQPRAKQ